MKKMLLWIVICMMAFAPAACTGTGADDLNALGYTAEDTVLDLGRLKVSMKDLTAYLDTFPALEHVDMFGTPVQKADIKTLTERYPQVTFGWTIYIPGPSETVGGHWIRTDQTAFSTLHGQCKLHSTAELEVLRYCTQLVALDLGHNKMDDISWIADLKQLRVLILACNEIRDISPLAELTDLEYLELFTNPIRDISPLAGLEHLMDLNLYNTELRSLEPLTQLHSLQRLWAGNMSVGWSRQLLNAVEEGNPGVKIFFRGEEATWNGWRVDPHYDVIYEIFHTGVYIPFEDGLPWNGGN